MTIKTADIPVNLFERSQWIITQLRLRGLTLKQLAENNDLHGPALSLALRGPHGRGEEVIAAALGTTPRVLFKERFTDKGERIYARRDRPSSIRAETYARAAAGR